MTLTEIAGSALLHFVWQGGVIALVTYVVLWVLRHQTPAARYAVACAALLTMLAMPVVTISIVAGASSSIQTTGTRTSATASFSAEGSGQRANRERPLLNLARFAHVGPPGPRVLTFIVWFWAIGVALLTTRTAAGWWRVRRLHRQAIATQRSIWQKGGDLLAARLQVRTAVRIAESALVDTPAVVGWLRPVILLPLASLASLTPAQLEAILIHELAHIRRHDYLVNLVQTVAETLLFYHPGVWWVSARMRAEREHCCDDLAVQMCGNPAVYADALVLLESQRFARRVLAPAATNGPLARRVRRILQVRSEKATPSAGGVVTICLATAFVIAGGMLADRQSALRGAPQATIVGNWEMRATDHIEIYYRPSHAALVDRIAGAAEAAYAQLRTAMRHDLAFKVPLITLTAAELRPVVAQNGFVPISQGSAAFGPELDKSVPRMIVPVDLLEQQPRLIAHEMTHMFIFDILPLQRWNEGVPAWLPEGLAEYVAGVWTADATEAVRTSLARRAFVPSELDTRFPQSVDDQIRHLGHAAVDFIDHEFGQAGIRRFLLALRSGSGLSGSTAYETAFGVKPEEFDRDFDRFMQERFSR